MSLKIKNFIVDIAGYKTSGSLYPIKKTHQKEIQVIVDKQAKKIKELTGLKNKINILSEKKNVKDDEANEAMAKVEAIIKDLEAIDAENAIAKIILDNYIGGENKKALLDFCEEYGYKNVYDSIQEAIAEADKEAEEKK